MTTTSKITIIGGGIIGLLTAREFFNAGATVTIIEKQAVGQESSWAGGGILLPLYPWRQKPAITDLVLPSLRLYPDLAQELQIHSGIDPQWTQCGLVISQNPDYDAAVAWCEASAINYQIADARFFQDLNTPTQQPLWLPDIANVRNPRLLQALKQDLQNKGVEFIEHCELHAVCIENHRIQAIETSHGRKSVEQLVITTGAWTGQLFSQLFDMQINIVPVKGQMLLFDTPQGSLQHIILAGDQYLIPRRDGKILAGSTVEQVGFDKTTTATAHENLRAFATQLMPALQNYPLINHWAGLRPATVDGVPIISLHPDIVNLSINAGHFRNGLAMGPASAKLLVDLVLQRRTTLNPEPYCL
jgi:glycine oxidase